MVVLQKSHFKLNQKISLCLCNLFLYRLVNCNSFKIKVTICTVKVFRIKSFETFLIEMNVHFTTFWFRYTIFSVHPAACSARSDKQTIINWSDRFTALSWAFHDKPGQIFSKVKLELLFWIFPRIRKLYTFHTFICALLQIWLTTAGWIIISRSFAPTLFCNSIYYDV